MSVVLCAGMVAVPLLCLRSASAPAARQVVAAAGPTVADLASRRFGAVASRSANRDLPEPPAPIEPTTTAPARPAAAPAHTVRRAATVRRPPPLRAAPVTRRSPPTTRPAPPPTPPPPAHQATGRASWYDGPDGTCAFNNAPLGTTLTVTNVASGRSTTCRVTSRGPFNGRLIDLTRSTFARIASTSQGVIDVRVTW